MSKNTKRHTELQEKLEEWARQGLRGKQAWVQYKDVDKTWERIGKPKAASLERFRNIYYEVKRQIKRDRGMSLTGIKYERITLITATHVPTGEHISALDYIEVDNFDGACEILERASEELELTMKQEKHG